MKFSEKEAGGGAKAVRKFSGNSFESGETGFPYKVSFKCIFAKWFQYLLQFPNALILSYCMHKEVLESSLKQKDQEDLEGSEEKGCSRITFT